MDSSDTYVTLYWLLIVTLLKYFFCLDWFLSSKFIFLLSLWSNFIIYSFLHHSGSMTSIFSIVYFPYVFVICDSILFLVMSNGNVNISPVSENDLFISVLYIGDAFHAYIANNIPILHCYFVDTSVSWSLWIFL